MSFPACHQDLDNISGYIKTLSNTKFFPKSEVLAYNEHLVNNEPCIDDIECPPGYVCKNGDCMLASNNCNNNNCGSGYICINGVCTPNTPGPPNTPETISNCFPPCPTYMYCNDGDCKFH